MRAYQGEVQVFGHTVRQSKTFTPLYATNSSFCLTIVAPDKILPPLDKKDGVGKAVERNVKKWQKFKGLAAIIILKPIQEDSSSFWFEIPPSFSSRYTLNDPFVIPGFHPLLEMPPGTPTSLIITNPEKIAQCHNLLSHRNTLFCIPVFQQNSLSPPQNLPSLY